MPCTIGNVKNDTKNNIKNDITRRSQDNGLMTKVWGPPGWLFLHSIAAGYPINPTEDHKENYFNFFTSIGYVLPCKYCRESYNNFLKESHLNLKDHLESRNHIQYWLYKIQNKVNGKLGVPECEIPSFKDHKKKFEKFRAKCSPTTEEERRMKHESGCVIPKNGISKKCSIEILDVLKGTENFEDTLKFNVNKLLHPKEHFGKRNSTCFWVAIGLFCFVVLLLIILAIYYNMNKSKT